MEGGYRTTYQELKCIGRGNYGSAYIIERKGDGEHFLGKKVNMDGLSEKERDDAVQEATMLKSLSHPNIVTYYGSFVDQNQLIIVMQYCEVGDIAYHIRKRKDKQQFFTEAEIMNWFVQICLALMYIHQRKVLHRDIKSSNIFLTGNNTVKLGDFGISRVLTNSIQAANTVVGTPYYMSPEICQNKPYSYKSDVWSLGCVLYEICTLNRAFSADNLLGLVYKIVQDKYEPIPAHYSKELALIIQKLLTKDETQRPSILDILRMPFVSNYMQQFVECRGLQTMDKTLTLRRAIPVGMDEGLPRKATVAVQRQKQKEEDKYAGLTPKQRRDLKRQEQNDRRAQELKAASRQAFVDKQKAKQRKEEQFIGNLSTVSEASHESTKQGSIQLFQTPAKLEGTTASSFQANDRTTDTFALSDVSPDSAQTFPSQLDETQVTGTQDPRFSNYSPTQHKKKSTPDVRPITGTGTYDLSKLTGSQDNEEDDEDDEYSDDFEDYEATSGHELAKQNEEELKEVLGVYTEALQLEQAPMESPSPKKGKTASIIESPPSFGVGGRVKTLRDTAEKVLGQKGYADVYAYLKEEYNKNTDSRVLRQRLKEGLGSDKAKLDACFLIDQILFLEAAQ